MYIEFSQKLSVNVDWLSFNVKLNDPEPELTCPNGYRLEIYEGNNIYKHRSILFNEGGRKILTCLWCPHSSILNKLIMTCQVANSYLYEDGGIDFAFNLLQQIVDCEFNAVSRVDICCDFEASPRQLGLIRKLASGACYVQGKREGSQFWHESNFKNSLSRMAHCLSWGSKQSEIKVKVYNKSREQQVDGNGSGEPDKPYIVATWSEFGMDISKVWRLEFSMSSAGQLRYDNKCISLEDVSSPFWFVRVFAGMLAKRFVVRRNQGRRNGHCNDDEIVQFLRFPREKEFLKWQDVRQHRLPDSEVITSLRKALGLLETPVAMCNEKVFRCFAESVIEIVESNNLDRYFNDRYGCSPRAYCEGLLVEVGEGCHDVELKPSLKWT